MTALGEIQVEKYFGFNQYGTSYRTEFIGGLTTFLSMCYILVANPMILGEAGMDKGAVFTATALSAIIGTLVMGILANYPLALAPSLGLNSFFAYSVVIGMGVPWETALAGVLVAGLIFVGITAFKIREKIIDVIPEDLKYAIAGGIGFFIAFIGLKNAGIIVSDPATYVAIGNLHDHATLLAVFGFVITVVFLVRGLQGGIFYGMVATTVIGILVGIIDKPTAIIGAIPSLGPTFGVAINHITDVFNMDMVMVVFTFLFVSFFDASGTLIAVANQAGIMKNNKIPRISRALAADASASVVGSVLGTSTVTALIESSAGIGAGARTGFSSVVVAGFFGLAMFFSPLLAVITAPVTAPALIIVGSMMASQIYKIKWDRLDAAVPAFITIIMMPLTFSVATGIALGFVMYPIIKLAMGKKEEVHPLMYGLMAIFIAYFAYLK
jgi:AGZA family xanthine/uracil permease-like MFS transporter